MQTWHPNALQDRNELRAVPALPGGQDDRQRLATLLTTQVHLRGQACACRKPRPYRSSGMSVLVQDAAESIASSDIEAAESVRFGDRLGERAQGCRRSERPVGSVLVVERLVLAERVHHVGLVHDQGAVEEFGSA